MGIARPLAYIYTVHPCSVHSAPSDVSSTPQGLEVQMKNESESMCSSVVLVSGNVGGF